MTEKSIEELCAPVSAQTQPVRFSTGGRRMEGTVARGAEERATLAAIKNRQKYDKAKAR